MHPVFLQHLLRSGVAKLLTSTGKEASATTKALIGDSSSSSPSTEAQIGQSRADNSESDDDLSTASSSEESDVGQQQSKINDDPKRKRRTDDEIKYAVMNEPLLDIDFTCSSACKLKTCSSYPGFWNFVVKLREGYWGKKGSASASKSRREFIEAELKKGTNFKY
jgi:hypothetical protein